MQNIRKGVEALERVLSMKQSPPVWAFKRDPVTGQWMGHIVDGVDDGLGIALMFCDEPPDPKLVTEVPAHVIDPAWERRNRGVPAEVKY